MKLLRPYLPIVLLMAVVHSSTTHMRRNFPFMLSMVQKLYLWSDKVIFPLCGCTILQKYWALTSASCISTSAKIGEYMDLGYIVLRGNTSTYDCIDNGCIDHHVNYHYIHPSYVGYDYYDYDIGIINVFEPFVGLYEKPVRLVPKGYKYVRYTKVVAIAWETENYTSSLKTVHMELRPFEECKNAYEKAITRKMVCAGNPRKPTCYAGHGAPLMQNSYQIGISSHFKECTRDKLPGLYTRLAKYLDLIDEGIDNFNKKFGDD